MPQEARLQVVILSSEKVIYEGEAVSVILPGEKGVFEVLAYHKGIMSRLLRGKLIVDGHALPIKRGVARVGMNQVTVVVEEDTGSKP